MAEIGICSYREISNFGGWQGNRRSYQWPQGSEKRFGNPISARNQDVGWGGGGGGMGGRDWGWGYVHIILL